MDSPDDAPDSPDEPRPDGKPYYINDECETCGTELVPYSSLTGVQLRSSDELVNPQDAPAEPWHDEFVCPICLDGVYMDWPEEHWDELESRMDKASDP